MTYNYHFYQLRDCPENAPRLFLNYEATVRQFGGVDPKLYQLAHCGTIEANNAEEACEKLFALYNTDRPADFRGRSMSISDVVLLDTIYRWADADVYGDQPKHLFFCDSIGFRRLV